MIKLSIVSKHEALTNALDSCGIHPKYFIVYGDGRLGRKFAIATNTEKGGIQTHTNYMTYEEMNAFLMGYNTAQTNPFK